MSLQTSLRDLQQAEASTTSLPEKPIQPPMQSTGGPRHQSAIPDIQLGLGDWFDFVKVYLARLFQVLHIADWFVSVKKINMLRDLLHEIAKGSQRIIAVVNSKGGAGKTPLATLVAAVMQWAFGWMVLLDANENNGNAAEQLDIDRNHTRTLLRGAINDEFAVATLSRLIDDVGIHKETNLLCLASDPRSASGSFSTEKFQKMVKTLFASSCHSLVCDTGNGNANVPNLAMPQLADILLVPVLADKASSFGSAVTTLRDYYDLGYTDIVQESFLVVLATTRRDTKKRLLATFRKEVIKQVAFDKKDKAEHDMIMEQLGITEENIYMIPYSRFVKERSDCTTLNPRDVGIRTLFAILTLAIAIFRREIASATEKTARNLRASETQRILAAQKAHQEALQRGEYDPMPAS